MQAQSKEKLANFLNKVFSSIKEATGLQIVRKWSFDFHNCHEYELWGWGLVQACRVRQVWAGRCTTDKMVLALTTFLEGYFSSSKWDVRVLIRLRWAMRDNGRPRKGDTCTVSTPSIQVAGPA